MLQTDCGAEIGIYSPKLYNSKSFTEAIQGLQNHIKNLQEAFRESFKNNLANWGGTHFMG